jgi:hypothetical protein
MWWVAKLLWTLAMNNLNLIALSDAVNCTAGHLFKKSLPLLIDPLEVRGRISTSLFQTGYRNITYMKLNFWRAMSHTSHWDKKRYDTVLFSVNTWFEKQLLVHNENNRKLHRATFGMVADDNSLKFYILNRYYGNFWAFSSSFVEQFLILISTETSNILKFSCQ